MYLYDQANSIEGNCDSYRERVERKIFLIRGHKVMLDRDLAILYEVKSIALRQQVKRNTARFPDDFMFQLTADEVDILVSQKVIPSRRSLGGALPYAFTEQGVAMLATVLKSGRAVQVSIAIARAFVKLRQLLATQTELSSRLDDLEKRYDKQFRSVFEAIRQLMFTPAEKVPARRRIGFLPEGRKS